MTLHIELPGLASVIILVCISYQQTIQKKWFCSYKICDMKFVIRHERCQINKLRQVQKMHILDKNVILCCVGFICFLTKISYFHAIALLWKILKLKMIALCLFFFFFSSPTWSPEIICVWIFQVKVFLKDTWSWNCLTTVFDSISSCFI